MKLCCYDQNKKLRIFEVEDTIDLTKQDQIKTWLQLETGVQVSSPVFGLITNPKLEIKK